MKIKIEEIRQLCIDVLIKSELSNEDATLIVDEYLDGELRGRVCHWFAGFSKFAVKAVKSRKGEPKIIKDSDTYLLMDGAGNLGQIIFNKLIPKIIEKSKKKGIAMAGVYNMESYTMPGTYARMAAEQGMIAMLFNYGGAERIAPIGSIDPVFGTNPIAISIPTRDKPIVLDMATSAIAMGKVRLALKLREDLPKGVAVNKSGNPTTDPQEAMDGAIFSFGGHKGYGLALIIEILSRCLLDVHKEKDEIYRGYFFIIIDPSKFIGLDKFKENIEELKNKIKESRKADGVDKIYLPGEKSDKIKEKNLKLGYLEIDDKIINEIKNIF